jgi:hypothetical protein
LALLSGVITSRAQSLLFPQEYLYEQFKHNERLNLKTDSIEKTCVFPLIEKQDSFCFYKSGRKWLGRKLLQDNFIQIKKNDTINGEVNTFELIIDPIFNFSAGQEQRLNKSIKTYNNTRGVIASLKINQQLKLETSFIENQSVFPEYISDQITLKKDALGQGRWKTFKTNGFDYAMSSGVLWWKINKNVQLFAGHGKQKIGNGYRSFLLSDQSFNYPYLRFDFSFLKSKIHYTSTYAVVMNLTPTIDINQNKPYGTEALLQKKPFSYQYVSFNLLKSFQFGLFQGIVWPAGDEKNKLHLSANYFNPIVFTNLAVYGFHSKPLILAGLDGQILITKTFRTYFQLCTDGKKDSLKKTQSFGLQTGIKWFNAFGLKNLFFQIEYNEYNDALYQSNNRTQQDTYSHYNQSLGFTFNSKSRNEAVCLIAYRYKRLMLSLKNNYFRYYTFKESTLLNEGKLSYLLQPKTNMNISLSVVTRNLHHNSTQINSDQSKWLFISFATSLFNRYFDTE